MGLARVQDVLVKTSTSSSRIIRFGWVASALGIAISWPSEANAQVVDAPPHRVEFTVSAGLPKCSNYDEFYGIIVNWVRVRSIDPTAKRRLVVRIERLADGQKRAQLTVLDAEGVEVVTEAHRYSSTEECFKILYWTAFDAAKLLQLTVPPPEEEPPMSVAKLVEESEKTDQVQEKQRKPTATGPIYDDEFYSEPKSSREQCASHEEPRLPLHVVAGVGATIGLTRTIMPGFRLGLGRTVGPVLFELDARAFPPLTTADWSMGSGEQVSGRAQTYVGTFATCAHKKPLIGCALVMGGVSQYLYDQPTLDRERYAGGKMGGVFLLGMRAGFALPLSSRWALRFDVEGAFPVYMSDSLRASQQFGRGESLSPVWSGFVSVVPSF